VTADELGRGIHDDVNAVLERAQQVRRDGVVEDQRDGSGVRHLREALEVRHVELGVADRFSVDRRCVQRLALPWAPEHTRRG
jgi:hypothetical protein